MSSSCSVIDCSPPGSSVHGVSQVRRLEWVANSCSKEPSDPGIKLTSPALQADSFTSGASLVAQLIKKLPAVWETWVQSLVWEDPLEKGLATHSSTLAWRIPWTERPSKLQSMGSQRFRCDWAIFTFFYHWATGETLWTWWLQFSW